jgi:hypothetical protein
VVDRDLVESLVDLKEGRAYGPFASGAELVASLHEEASKLRSKKSGRKASGT